MLWPAIITLANRIAVNKPVWAIWGGTMVLMGLFARTFHAGIDHLAFQLVNSLGLKVAIDTIGDSYGAVHIVSALTPLIVLGWIVLAIGAYRSGSLNIFRSIGLALMSMLMLGVLKGSSTVSIVATSGLCTALLPLGIKVLHEGNLLSVQKILVMSAMVTGITLLLFYLGSLG